MLLQIFGLPHRPSWWHISRIPSGGGSELEQHLRTALTDAQNMEFFLDSVRLSEFTEKQLSHLWGGAFGQLVAKPVGASTPYKPEPRLLLMTTRGPDAGRIFPLTRRNLSVGRGAARIQIRDPWLSSHDFDIRLSPDGIILTPTHERNIHWQSDITFVSGKTTFEIHRGPGKPLQAPRNPGQFEASPGQPPARPNILLQIIGAAAPLMIGLVLVVVTGMWYFLLFSGVSVIIAAVLITQYRRARAQFVEKIHKSLATRCQTIREACFTPQQLVLALSSDSADPLAFATKQPEHPVLHLGLGLRKAVMPHMDDASRWNAFLQARVELVVSLEPGRKTFIVGDPETRQSLKNWCIAQLLRHVEATGTGVDIDGAHVGGARIVTVSDHVCDTPVSDTHQLVFTDKTNFKADELTTIVDLYEQRVAGVWSASNITTTGISRQTLERIADELHLDQPNAQSEASPMKLTPHCMHHHAAASLLTTLGSGTLGLEIDLVSEGPHLMITGTTGSGKSELLLTLLTGFVHRYPPAELSMILLDFKGGSSFNVLAELPHIMSVETNHVLSTSFRSLKAITAELFRRESLFAEYQAPDYTAFRRKVPNYDLPRLVVAIDEMRVLVEQNPEASSTLAHLAATGRSLGFHLIIATQRIQGAINSDIRANMGSSISLRTATEHDSWEALGTAEAYSITPKTPGRAYFKAGANAPQLFQTSRYLLDDEPVLIERFESMESTASATTTNWPAVVRYLSERATEHHIPKPVLLPALPKQVHKSRFNSFADSAVGTAIGLVDDPGQAQQYPLFLGQPCESSPHHVLAKSVAWIGTADSGIDDALQTVLDHVLRSEDRRIFLDGRTEVDQYSTWDTYLHSSAADGDLLKQTLSELTSQLGENRPTSLVISDWGSWSDAVVTGSFQGFEEQLIQIMRQYSATLRVFVFGSRELAGGRLLGMIPDRLYLPKGSSAEHQLIWPRLLDVPPIKSRAVLVTAETPQVGWEVQLLEAS
ncbi:MAG TPA: FtsK/SpoIIIE domain-containing protein [Enteractinococcus sp.]